MTPAPQPDVNVLFVCPGRYSLGELHNALTAARQLELADIVFCAATPHLDYVRSAGFRAVSFPTGADALRRVRAVVSTVDPDLVVLADHHLLSIERNAFTVGELVDALDVPIVILDSLGWVGTVDRLELAVSRVFDDRRVTARFPREIVLPPVPAGIGVLRPAPVASSALPGAFALYPNVPLHRPRAAVRAEHGWDDDELVVVLAQSAWARQAFDLVVRVTGQPKRPSYLELLVLWVGEALRRLGRRFRVVTIGGEDTSGWLGADVRTTSLPPCSLDRFTDLVAAAGLFLSDNLTSAAMARAVRCGTPSLALVNEDDSRSHDEFSVAWRRQLNHRFPGFDFPFVVNPFGWQAELEPLRRDNPYLSALPTAPIFDLEAVQLAITEAVAVRPSAASAALAADQARMPDLARALRTLPTTC